ncbi:hypothetical protein K8R78_02195 [bacterium]|nr:hypothetical protein [bacterium]
MKRAGLALLVVIVGMLLITACTDPVSNCLYRDQDQPGGTISRLNVYPANDAVRYNIDARNLVYREWVSGTPEALEDPYFCFYMGGPENLYKGFNIYRREGTGDYTLLAENQKPESLRTVPTWNSGATEDQNDPIFYDTPTAGTNELDFPAYLPTLDGFKGEQYPGGNWAPDHGTTAPWDTNGWSRYYPYHYFGSDNRAYGFVDEGFDIVADDMADFTWAVVVVDANGNMGAAFTSTCNPHDFE